MLLSMTGYGKTESQFRNRTLVCEVRSLNSKALDLSVRIAPTLRAKELDIRTQISKRVERGKVDIAIYMQDSQTEEVSFTPINWEAVRFYSAQYKEHIGQYDSNEQIPAEIMAAILRMPDVIKVQEDASEMTDEEWTAIQRQIDETLDAFVAFRTQEGQALQQ
ncbi:MAG: YicC/YloC family endoribonuclease, partial [Paludibacteraceae bacterium]|nr:YicC/YloC family endoribonuclease [Paludibacteraceae bacterium]